VLGLSLRSLRAPVLLTLSLSAGLFSPRPADAASPLLVIPPREEAEATAAYRYANMTNEEALAELDRRSIPYVAAEPVVGVRAPVRLTGRLHGVYIHSALPLDQRATTIFEILDARLALALDDFAAVLEKHDIDEVVHYTMYRPNVPKAEPKAEAKGEVGASPKTPPSQERAAPAAPAPKAQSPLEAIATKAAKLEKAGKKKVVVEKTGAASPKGTKQKAPIVTNAPKPREIVGGNGKKAAPVAQKTAAVAQKPAAAAPKPAEKKPAEKPVPPKIVTVAKPHQQKWAPPGTRHPAGLAIDVGMLHKKDGTWLSVAEHFHGQIGEKTCGDGARVPEQAQARELRALVCESQAEHIFTYVLSPNYDVAHADHFHMEIKPGVFWFLTH